MKEIIIRHAVTALINALPPTLLAEGADRLLDLIENLVEQSDTPIDDAVILPITKAIRAAFGIEERLSGINVSYDAHPDNDL